MIGGCEGDGMVYVVPANGDSIFEQPNSIIASKAKQSIGRRERSKRRVDCFVARAPRNDGKTQLHDLAECFFREVSIYFPPSPK